VLVLYAGRIVEFGSRETFSAAPFHPYTDLLIRSVPELAQGWLERSGHPPSKGSGGEIAPGLCPFLDRCPVIIPGQCDRVPPPWHHLAAGNSVLCHHTQDALAGERAMDEGARSPRG
jgi:peptide/nickel transport system ATP-binding protein